MGAELIIAPEAEQDLIEAFAWYEDQRPGLGEEFLSCVDASLQAILRMPEMHRVVYEGCRRALIRRFPYAVFYEFMGQKVMVYAIFHVARDPEKWRKRLSQ